MSSPDSRMRPSSGVSKPASMRNSVVLPQPLGPSSAKNSPARMSSETPSTARKLPKVLTTFSIRRIGGWGSGRGTGDDGGAGSAAGSEVAMSSAMIRSNHPCRPERHGEGKLAADGLQLNRTGRTIPVHLMRRHRALVTGCRGHEGCKRLLFGGAEGQAELGPPPQHVVRKAGPFLGHEIADLGLRQLRSERAAQLGPAAGVPQEIGRAHV